METEKGGVNLTAAEFEYDGIKSSVYGLYICSFDGMKNGVSSLGNEITINSIKSPGGKRFIWTESVYETPLSFTFQVIKYDCTHGSMEIGARELAEIMRWLTRTDNYHYLRFAQDGWDHVFYNCYLKVQKYETGGKIYGLEIEAVCDAPWGYSEPKHILLDFTENSSCRIYNYSDEDGSMIPDLVKIEIAEACNLEITNTFLIKDDPDHKKTVTMKIDNCKKGEIIQTDRHKNICSTLPHDRGLANDFNFHFIELFSDFKNPVNTISSNAKCIITMDYREIRKGVC